MLRDLPKYLIVRNGNVKKQFTVHEAVVHYLEGRPNLDGFRVLRAADEGGPRIDCSSAEFLQDARSDRRHWRPTTLAEFKLVQGKGGMVK